MSRLCVSKAISESQKYFFFGNKFDLSPVVAQMMWVHMQEYLYIFTHSAQGLSLAISQKLSGLIWIWKLFIWPPFDEQKKKIGFPLKSGLVCTTSYQWTKSGLHRNGQRSIKLWHKAESNEFPRLKCFESIVPCFFCRQHNSAFLRNSFLQWFPSKLHKFSIYLDSNEAITIRPFAPGTQ